MPGNFVIRVQQQGHRRCTQEVQESMAVVRPESRPASNV